MSGGSPADLEALGFRREGDIWFDESGTTMVAFHRRSGEDLASVQSVLEDGTNVLTEERGSFLAWLRRPVATKLPTEGLSVAFPLDVYDVKQLVAAHRAHVERTEAKRKSNVKSGMSIETFVAARNDVDMQVSAVRGLLRRVGFALGGLWLFGGALVALLQAVNGRTEQLGRYLAFGLLMGVVNYFIGSRFFGPSLVFKGTLAAKVPRTTEVASRADVTSIRPKSAWGFALVWAIFVGATVGTALSGVGGLPMMLESLLVMAIGERAMATILDRKGRGTEGRRATWAIEGGVLRVAGERSIPLAEISAVFRNDEPKPTLVVLDGRGRVALRLEGAAETLDEIRAAIAPRRASLPITRDFRQLGAFLLPMLAAVVLSFARPAAASISYGIAATVVALAPLSRLRRRKMVDVGVDGLVIDGRFLAFADLASIETTGDRVNILEKNGERTSLELEQTGSTSEIARRWAAHTERSDNRDEAALVRRRVAVEEEAEEAVPYRARIASPEELGEALLDSAEARSVRIRAAKRLARSEDEDAARIREEAEARVLDPDVRHALDRPRE